MPKSQCNNSEGGRRNEAELVRRVLEGDSSAFIELIKPYKDKIKRWCQDGGKLWNAEDIDDAVAETLERTYRSLHKFDCDRQFGPWLRKIAKRSGIEIVRRKGRHRQMVSLESLSSNKTTGRNQGWRDRKTQDPIVSAIEREIVEKTLQKLPTRQREALELHLRSFSNAEIADTLKTTESGVVVLLRRARERFEQVLRKLGEEK